MENYHDIKDRESFSSISALASGPKEYLKFKEKVEDEIPDYFIKGKIVDDLRCLTPVDNVTIEQYFDDNYVINTLDTPTGQDFILAKYLIEKYDTHLDITNEAVLDAIKELVIYGSTKKEELLVAKYKQIEDYVIFNISNKHSDRKVISFEIYSSCLDIIYTLIKDETISPYMNNESTEEIEVYNELPILWELTLGNTNIPMKSKLDKVIVNKVDKTIQIIDFKTTGDNTSKFTKSYIQFRYYYQASLYLTALHYKQVKEEWYIDYTILPFKFIVANDSSKPLIFVVNDTDIKLSTFGESKIGFNKVKGWMEVLKDLIWYNENGFETEKEYKLNGSYELKVFEKA